MHLCSYFTVLFGRLRTAVQFISFLLSFFSSGTLVAKVSSVTTAKCCGLRRMTLPACYVLSTQRKAETVAIRAWFQAVTAIWIRSALFWDVTQRGMVIWYRRVGTTYRSHLGGQEVSDLKMGPTGCPKTSVSNYHSTLRNIPEERRCHILHILRAPFRCQVQPLADSISYLRFGLFIDTTM